MSLWTRMAGRVRAGRDDGQPAERGGNADPSGAAPRPHSDPASTGPDASAALVRRLRQGDASALEPIYRAESPGVYRYALALCRQPDWAADAMQEAFVQFATRPEGWDAGRGSLGAYLAGMARHHLLGRWRDRPQADDPMSDPHSADEDQVDSPEQQLVRAQDQAQLWEALQSLPWTFREAVVLVDLQERPYAEAARIAGIELNTLRTRLHRGRARLLAALTAPAPGGEPMESASTADAIGAGQTADRAHTVPTVDTMHAGRAVHAVPPVTAASPGADEHPTRST
ncbi:RNA polymerase sigma factor [Roseateles amylovorans]|uniref:RNA polymerase sigma factor n=1 Tax=Roseateles amylovorans TaxID=2978473 RepID=A0ABY6B060_9BURK|nr:RNA polymerase sigma factor [Roseateles amylovorans]UXH78332.1 RNA polymerase sigma factor [Roseateles amylovorans]